jgi:DNA-directed RNA polymerase subunit RPC12/RpoP
VFGVPVVTADEGRPLCAVDGCDRPVPDQAYICPEHARWLEGDVGDVPALASELVTTWSRQARTGDRGGPTRRAAEPPLPYDLGVGRDLATLAGTVASWARHVAEERGLDGTRLHAGPVCGSCAHASCAHLVAQRAAVLPRAADDPVAVATVAARWLLAGRHVEWLRHRPEAVEASEELRYAVALARRAIDRAEPRWYAGQCGAVTIATQVVAAVFGCSDRCQVELYALPGAERIRCPECGSEHLAAERRAWLLESARDVLAHAELIGRAASALGKPITQAMIRGYAARGRIAERGTDVAGRPVYQVGEILDVYDDNQRRRAEAALRRAVVEALRAEHPGMGVAELAELAGVTKGRVSQILGGRDAVALAAEQAQGGAA